MKDAAMLSRRLFAGCALCAGLGLIAAPGGAQTAVTRTVLRQVPLEGTNMVTIQAFVDLAPGALIARHTHPGQEGSVVLDGALNFEIDGQPLTLSKGDSFLVPAGVPHGGTNGPAATRLFATYVVDKDKPLASPA